MNKERILEIANDIEANGDTRPIFDMSDFFFPSSSQWKLTDGWCKTSACIAGYVSALKCNKKDFHWADNHKVIATEWLGLDPNEAGDLFYGTGRPYPMSLEDITAETAVVCLRHLAETGVVDWYYAVNKVQRSRTP